MKCTVVNVMKDSADIYIGRGKGSIFGNPFASLSRPEAIREYRRWFRIRLGADVAFLATVLGMRGKRLGCFCTPLACHGDVIANFVNTVEAAAAENPALPAPGHLAFACSVCTGLQYSQIPTQHTQCPECSRWYCASHLPKSVHNCPGGRPVRTAG